MKETNITTENLCMYEKFRDIKYHIYEIKHPILDVLGFSLTITGAFFLGLGGIVPYFLLINNFVSIFGINLLSCSPIIYSLIWMGGGTLYIATYYNLFTKVIPKVVENIRMKKFQKQYPNFDINTDVKEVEKALEKYRELSKIPKDIEEKKCEHVTNLPDEVKKMSAQEKLAYLESEKEFWEQVAIQEKYTNLDKQKEAIQKSLSK